MIRVIFSYADIQYKCIPRGIKKKKNIEMEYWRRIWKKTDEDFMDILKPLAALFQVGSLLV